MSQYKVSEHIDFAVCDADGTRVFGALEPGVFDLDQLDDDAARWVQQHGIPTGLVCPAATPQAPEAEEETP